MLDFGFYNMDCLEGMKQIPDKFFDLAICDPPYGIGYHVFIVFELHKVNVSHFL